MTGEVLRSMRKQGAADGRSASTRIDRVEQVVRRQCITLAKALGPDLLRDRLGAELALEVLEDAGADTIRISERWASEQAEREGRAPKQVTTSCNNPVEGDWRYDPRVQDAISRGVPDTEYQKIIAQVRADHAQRVTRKAHAGARADAFMWVDAQTGQPRHGDRLPVGLGVATALDGSPAQRSLVRGSVPELGSEQAGKVSMSDVRPVCAVCSEHEPREGQRYCPECGKARV